MSGFFRFRSWKFRCLFFTILVFLFFNPTGYDFVRWVIRVINAGEISNLEMAGIALVCGIAFMILSEVWKSLGFWGTLFWGFITLCLYESLLDYEIIKLSENTLEALVDAALILWINVGAAKNHFNFRLFGIMGVSNDG